jgi:hypothetical protein
MIHRALPPLGYTFERPVNMDALILADPEWCAVNETDTCAFAQQHFFDEKGQRGARLCRFACEEPFCVLFCENNCDNLW